DATTTIESHLGVVASIEELRALAREVEIDFDELTANVNDVLAGRPTASVGEVLSAHPATQGVASVVGLLSMAADHGTREDGVETLGWTGGDGRGRRANVERYCFTGRVS